MCLSGHLVPSFGKWNWDGDTIIRDSVVPSSRPAVGYTSLAKSYDIDVREFLVTEGNAMMHRTLYGSREDMDSRAKDFFSVRDYLRSIKGDITLFTSRKARSFDYRANILTSYVNDHISYQPGKGRDSWQFPDETIFLKKGDCEDRAILLASLLLASGISGYNVRVALGKVVHHSDSSRRKTTYDHVWVMYKSEAGRWLLLELFDSNRAIITERTSKRSSKSKLLNPSDRIEYIPFFLFNKDHLWRVEHPKHPRQLQEVLSKDWHKLNPKFVGEVHKSILNEALAAICPQPVLDNLNRHFNHIGGIGPLVDDVDDFTKNGYHPFDHFDNGYIDESWGRVKARLDKFNQDNADIDSFAYAAHGIADFYSHSSYLHFAKLNPEDGNESAVLCDPDHLLECLEQEPVYSAASKFELNSNKQGTSINPEYWIGPTNEAAALWNKKLISGRFAQKNDSHDILEGLVCFPKELTEVEDFKKRGALPHHNEIAVDKENGRNNLYKPLQGSSNMERYAYRNQYRWRYNTAVRHIKKAFTENWHS